MASHHPNPGGYGPFGSLLPLEIWWRNQGVWLEQRGYRMRPRYRLDWVPPWKKDIDALRNIDGWFLPSLQIMDATRISDGKLVALKKIRKRYVPAEEEVHRLFGMGDLARDSRNHCIPLIEVLEVPDDPSLRLLVMPYAGPIDHPPWDTVGEALDCIRQIIEGVVFMHEHHFAHRDCIKQNIMMDIAPIFPDAFHPVDPHRRQDGKGSPKSYPRTRRSLRYWLIDLGLSRQYLPEDGPPLDTVAGGHWWAVPEGKADEDGLYNPFPVDVFYIGSWLREEFIEKHRHNILGFLGIFADDMCAEDPTKRPKMSEVLERLDRFIANADIWTLRARPKPYDEFWTTPFRAFGHWWRQIFYVATGTPAVPRPLASPSADPPLGAA